MKGNGTVKRVDRLGRVVLPKPLMASMGIAEGTMLEIYANGINIMLRKHSSDCIFCGEVMDTLNFKDKNICRGCAEELEEGILHG